MVFFYLFVKIYVRLFIVVMIVFKSRILNFKLGFSGKNRGKKKLFLLNCENWKCLINMYILILGCFNLNGFVLLYKKIS